MRSKYCKTCLYDDICESRGTCKHYCPVDEDVTTANMDRYIEKNRHEYQNDWWRYIDEDTE